jgi:hypothetical protein
VISPASGLPNPLLRLLTAGDNAVMQTEPSKAEPPKRKRRWFQFSLRSLLIFTVVCAVASPWLGRKIEQKREAAAAITKLGGLVFYDYQLSSPTTKIPTGIPPGPDWLRHLLGENFFSEVLGVILNERSTVSDSVLVNLSGLRGMRFLTLSDANISDAGLVNLNGLVQLRTLDLSRTKISDDGLVHVKRLTNLKSLDLNQTAVGGAGLAHLAGLTLLEKLDLRETNVTDAGLAHLARLTSLEKLDLRDTNVTDAGLVHLEGLAQLKELDLHGTKVSDPGLACLKKLTSLRTLYLELTNVTRAGVEDLQNALPNCEIGFWHSDEPFRPNRSE